MTKKVKPNIPRRRKHTPNLSHQYNLIVLLLLSVVGVLSFLVLGYVSAARPTPTPTVKNQGLQSGWAIDDSGNLDFPHSVLRSLPLMKEAGAGWVRINFRLGSCYNDWVTLGCNGKTALEQYTSLVNSVSDQGLKVLGLLSNESQQGGQSSWQENNAENTAGNGDNAYIQAYAQTAVSLAQNLQGKVETWELWNEPNCWSSNPSPGVYTECSYIYPSNFAWMLKRVYEGVKTAGITVTLLSGGLLGHDIGGSFSPGSDYLTNTYNQGIAKADWEVFKQTYGTYPLDQIGYHLYIDQGGTTSSFKVQNYLNDIRNAYVAFEGAATGKKIAVTEFGWTTVSLSERTQANNLKTAYMTFKNTSYVLNGYWFKIQDENEFDPNSKWGLQTNGSSADNWTGVHKQSFFSYQKNANF